MSKGIRMTCQHCNRDQDVTEVVADDVLGYPYPKVQKILACYRENVDPAHVMEYRLAAHEKLNVKMFKFLQRVASSHDCCKMMVEIRKFVKSVQHAQ